VKIFLSPVIRLAAVLLICLAFSLNVQAVKFYSINSLFGISSRVTNSICEDDNGFIWASSKTGILRLTDTDYRIYQLPYEKAGAIVVKLIYEHSSLIAYTNNGQVFSYDPVFDRFVLLIDISKTIKDEKFDVYNFLIDPSGDYWIALNSGLYTCHSGNLTLITEVLQQRYSVAWFDEQHLIITKSSGIWSLDIQTLASKCIFEYKSVSPLEVSSLCLDKAKDKLWIGTFSDGLYCYNFGLATLSHILESTFPKQPILAIEPISESTIWIGIDGQGVWELNKNDGQLLNVYKENADDPYSLRGNGVYDIFYDHHQRVWICTISGGVSFYELASPLVNQVVHHANDLNSLVNNDVNGIIEDRDGKIWFATNNGISCWDATTGQWKNLYCNKLKQAQVFLTLCEDDKGRIWAGSYSSGIYVLDRKTGKELAHYSRDEKEFSSVSNFIFDIFKDSQGDLWIGGINGKFVCYQTKENKFRTYSELSISSFGELSPNQILLGSSNAIKLLNKQTGEIKNFLSGYVVQDFKIIGDVVWVCTSGEGLLGFNTKDGSVKTYTTREGLPSNFLNSIIYADNCLWIGTESGLCRFNPSDQTAFTFSSLFPLSGISYNKSALFGLKDGQLAWGTNNGAIFFAPQSIREISSKGKLFFQDLTISGRSIREIPSFKLDRPVDSLKTLNLKYSQNTISLELISIGMQSASKFSWKLEGFDNQWTTERPFISNEIFYDNINPGTYKLQVQMKNANGIWGPITSSPEFTINKPYYLRWWFIVLGVMGFGFLVYIVQHYYEQRKYNYFLKKEINRVTTELTETETNYRDTLLKEIHHRVKNNMQIISSLLSLQSNRETDVHLNNVIKESQNRIRSMALIHEKLYQSKKFSELDLSSYVNSLIEYLKRIYLVNTSLIKVNLDIDEIYINIDVAIACGLIINELVSNSFKYAFPDNAKGAIFVEIQKQNQSKW